MAARTTKLFKTMQDKLNLTNSADLPSVDHAAISKLKFEHRLI